MSQFWPITTCVAGVIVILSVVTKLMQRAISGTQSKFAVDLLFQISVFACALTLPFPLNRVTEVNAANGI